MAKKILCHCGGKPGCKLCQGAGKYQYQPGPRGWMPFTCPTCEGTGKVEGDDRCFTCLGSGAVDPADPPSGGMMDVVWKSLFGAT